MLFDSSSTNDHENPLTQKNSTAFDSGEPRKVGLLASNQVTLLTANVLQFKE